MGDSAELRRLLREMAAVSSPAQRVKLLARAWRSLRRLDPVEIRELAANTGLDRAEQILDRLARGRGRLTPSLLLQGVRRARNVDRRQVEEVIAGLRDPKKRGELLRSGLQAVERLGADDEAAEPREAAPESPPVSPLSEVAKPPPGPPAVTETAEPPAPRPEPPESPLPSRPPRAPAARRREESTPEPVRSPSAKAATVTAAPVVAATPSSSVVPPPVTRPTPADGLVESIREAPTTMRRLRLLERQLPRARALDTDGLAQLIEAFPPGWARRRALAALLREGIPDNVIHAVSLIDRLETRTARRWCIGTILDGWDLAPHERDALTERYRVGSGR